MALGTFGAHFLKSRLTPGMLVSFETGVLCQICHALELMAVARAANRWSASNPPAAAGWLFVAGTVLLSCSLYVLALTRVRWLSAVTPFGGVAFVGGWFCLLLAAWRGRSGA